MHVEEDERRLHSPTEADISTAPNGTSSHLARLQHVANKPCTHICDAVHLRILATQPIGFLAVTATMHYSVNPPAGAPESARAHTSSTSAHHEGRHDSDHGSPTISPVGYHPPIDDEEARRRFTSRAPPSVYHTADPRSAPPVAYAEDGDAHRRRGQELDSSAYNPKRRPPSHREEATP